MEVLVSCVDYDSPVRNVEVSHCSLELDDLENTGAAAQLNFDDSVAGEAYGIRFRIIRQEYSCRIESPGLHFISSAQAIYPYQSYDYRYISQEEITDIKIESINQFDSDHPAGADVTDLFRALSEQEFKYFTVDDYRDRLAIETFGYENRDIDFDIFLMEPSASDGQQQFKVTIELSDGRTLEAMTEPIYFV
jgi:hypothetical protein